MLRSIAILPMSLTDVDEVMEIEVKSFTVPWSRAAYIEELLFNTAAMYFVAKLEDTVVSYAGIWVVLDEGHITNIAVHPEYRNYGIAQNMINTIIEFASSKGLSKVFLEVRTSNTAARKLYTKLGFIEDGIRKKYYLDNGEDAILMSRILQKDEE